MIPGWWKAHEQAVNEALRQLQSFAATRVRKNGECTDRLTGNIVAAVFQHETSRALDPHLHSHCILFNATFDPVEKKWKALQNYEMLAAQKFVENVYYHELARSLVKLGYQIENKPRGDFEIKGVSPELVKKFSKEAQRDRPENAGVAGTRTRKGRGQPGGDSGKHRAQGTGAKNPGHRLGKAAINMGRPDDFTGTRIVTTSHHQAAGRCRCRRRCGRNSPWPGPKNIYLSGGRLSMSMSYGVTRWNMPEAGKLRLRTFKPSRAGAIIYALTINPAR